MEPAEKERFDRLKADVNAAADALFAKGIRPTLAHIEADVKGPRQQLVWLLEDWAIRVASEGAESLSPDSPQLNRVAMSPNQRSQYALEMARAATAANRSAAITREANKRQESIREIELEIEKARARLKSMQASESVALSPESRAASIEKMRQRIAGLEGILAQLNEPDAQGPPGT